MFRFLARSRPGTDRRTAQAAGRAGLPRLGVEPLEDRSVPATLTFAAASYDAGPWAAAVAVTDFNRDGHPDLASATSNASVGSVAVLLGQGDGTFGPRTDFATDIQPMAIVVADLNGDGKQDLATPNVQSADNVSVLLGNGDGTFAPRTDFPVGSYPTALAVGDFNHDGRPDLAATNFYDSTVSVLLGTGNGTFAPKVDLADGRFSRAVAVGDFNRDGKQDLVTGNTGGVSVLLGNGDGTFAPKVEFATGTVVGSVVVADFDGDGRQDLATANELNNGISVLPGRGDGTFGPAVNLAAGPGPVSVVVADFNRDGKPDLATGNTGTEGGTTASVSVLLNTTIWSAAEGIDRASDGLDSLDLPGDVAQGISSKLDAAQAALDQGNNTAARNQIESAIRQLESLVQAGQLDAAEADPLIAALEAALALL